MWARGPLLLLGLWLSACGGPTAPSVSLSITYRVEGGTFNPTASMTYSGSGNSTIQSSRRTLPWTYTFTAARGGFLYISAQNDSEFGCVRVTIHQGETQLQSAQSCGAYVIATVSDTAR